MLIPERRWRTEEEEGKQARLKHLPSAGHSEGHHQAFISFQAHEGLGDSVILVAHKLSPLQLAIFGDTGENMFL